MFRLRLSPRLIIMGIFIGTAIYILIVARGG